MKTAAFAGALLAFNVFAAPHAASALADAVHDLKPAPGPATSTSSPAVESPAAPAPAAARASYLLPIPPRLQFVQDRGYCGEVSLQELLLPFGVWLPQAYTRSVGGGELLPGVNYASTMDALKLKYRTFGGAGYAAFFGWAKAQIMPPASAGVVAVVYLRGEADPDYDHIIPLTGVNSASPPASPAAAAYDATDVFYLNNGFSTSPIQRSAGSFFCPRTNKKDTLDAGGCVPSNTRWGYAVLGPRYAANTTAPRVSLAVPRTAEPGPPGSPGVAFSGTVRVSALRSGVRYSLYKLTSLAKVPSAVLSATATGPQLGFPGASLLRNFTASATTWSGSVTFTSSVPAWFVVVRAA